MEENKDLVDNEELNNKDNTIDTNHPADDDMDVNAEDNLSEEESKLEKLQEEYSDLNNSFLRLHAEFDNYRKRTIREKAELIKTGGERVLSEIISLVDDFERGLAVLTESQDKDAMHEGMGLIYDKFIHFLQQHGVKEIEVIGKPFDSEHSEAVTTVPVTDEEKKGMVIDCIQKGYVMNDKIIRYPKVIVGE